MHLINSITNKKMLNNNILSKKQKLFYSPISFHYSIRKKYLSTKARVTHVT